MSLAKGKTHLQNAQEALEQASIAKTALGWQLAVVLFVGAEE